MNILIMRMGLAIRSKEKSYNVQEIGLAKALTKMGHNAQVIYFLSGLQKKEQSDINEFVTYHPAKSIGHQVFLSNKELDDIKCDAVILFCDNKVSSNVVIKWCKEKKIPVVCYFGISGSNTKHVVQKLIYKLLTAPNNKILSQTYNITKTNSVKIELENLGIPVQKVVPVGLDESLLHDVLAKETINEIKHSLGLKKDEKIIAFVGRLTDEKKPLFALELIKKINVNGKYHLIMIGNGNLKEEVLSYVKRNSLEQFVTLIETVPYNEMYQYYAISDILINCREDEIFGMAILEGMYYGCKVIAHTAPGPNDIITNNYDGILIDNYDAQMWVDLICSSADKAMLSQNAKKTIRDRYLWNHIAEEFIKCISEGRYM